MSIARLLQISDLHVGELSANGLPHTPALYLRRPFNGWLGHDPNATRAVARFARALRREGVPLYVVTTGDLTAWGDPGQFAKATNYLGGVVLDGPSRVGLAEADWHDRAIPGNHDHWGGTAMGGTPWKFPYMLRPPTGAFTALFNHLPQTGAPPLTVPGLPPIRFIRLDTDADVHPGRSRTWLWDRFWARGSFRSHLGWLDVNLPAKADGEIRVVLAHHCLEARGIKGEIDAASRAAFDTFLVRHEVDILLSGHTHEVGISTPVVMSTADSRDLLYARCGTSTAVNPRDGRFKRRVGWSVADELTLPKSCERSVILHELSTWDDRIIWTATAYRLNRQNRFEPKPGVQVSRKV